jgi:ribosome recycling factor
VCDASVCRAVAVLHQNWGCLPQCFRGDENFAHHASQLQCCQTSPQAVTHILSSHTDTSVTRCRYEFPQDTKKDLEDGIQKLTDSFVKKLDEMAKAKSDDIMKV